MRHGGSRTSTRPAGPCHPRRCRSPTRAGRGGGSARAPRGRQVRPRHRERPAADVETAELVAPGRDAGAVAGAAGAPRRQALGEPPSELEHAFVDAFRGDVPNDRPSSAARRSASCSTASCPRSSGSSPSRAGTSCCSCSTAASTVRSSRTRSPASGVPRQLRAGARLRQRPRRRRRLDRARGERQAVRPRTPRTRETTMERLLGALPRQPLSGTGERRRAMPAPCGRNVNCGVRARCPRSSISVSGHGRERSVRELDELLALDRELTRHAGALLDAREQERIGLVQLRNAFISEARVGFLPAP